MTFRLVAFTLTLFWVLNSIAQVNFQEISEGNAIFSTEYSRGVSVADFDNDGDDDFYVLNVKVGESNKLFRNDGNFTFTDVSNESGLQIAERSKLALWFDANNDGWLDIYVVGFDHNRFFKNNRDGTFSNITALSRLDSISNTRALVVGDLNGDQWPDIFCHNAHYQESSLYINTGQYGFVNMIDSSGINSKDLPAMSAILTDLEEDGDLDLYCIYDNHFPNKFYKNDGTGHFEEVGESLNLNYQGDGMGVDIADFNHDTKNDFYITNLYPNALMMQNPNGSFTDKAAITDVGDEGMGWGTVCFDYNNDTYSDIFMVNSAHPNGATNFTNKLYRNNGDGTFSSVEQGSPLGIFKNSFSCATADFNGDGLLDLVIANSGGAGIQVMKNNENNTGNWGEFNLIGTTCNKFGVGARIETWLGNLVLKDEIHAGSGYASQNSYTIHFGLDDALAIDSLIVYWPDSKVEKYYDLKVNQRYLIVQHEGINAYNVDDFRQNLQTVSLLKPAINITDAPTALTYGKSVARIWNELLLEAIGSDVPKPTVDARNLFHLGVIMYDAWAAFERDADTYFLDKTLGSYTCPYDRINVPLKLGLSKSQSKMLAQREAMSYAAYRLLNHRFRLVDGFNTLQKSFDKIFKSLGFEKNFISADYHSGSPAALGNYLAEKIIEFGWQDGANEAFDYSAENYTLQNPAINPVIPGIDLHVDPNRWQYVSFDEFPPIVGESIPNVNRILTPYWGNLVPFSLGESDQSIFNKGSKQFKVFFDPGHPPYIDTVNAGNLTDEYKWNFTVVSDWSAQLKHNNQPFRDISPAALGNINTVSLPVNFNQYQQFFNPETVEGNGYLQNPKTNRPYTAQIVPAGDYVRLLTEYWTRGPRNESYPAHWFRLLNEVNDHPLMIRKLAGDGDELGSMEWDVKAYFILGAAMHDAAIATWSIKNYYDYAQPVTALRYMAQKGQSTQMDKESYHPLGLPLMDNQIEIIENNDPLAGEQGEHVGKIKIRAWNGYEIINNLSAKETEVEWMLAEKWVPYQIEALRRPAFSGYVSELSSFSQAAAKVLTLLTGDLFLPGGLGQFDGHDQEFISNMPGSPINITLQWATYQDAANQCGLSGIWAGIHSPIDDIAGRILGITIGQQAFNYAKAFFTKDQKTITNLNHEDINRLKIFPNPSSGLIYIEGLKPHELLSASIVDLSGKTIRILNVREQASLVFDVTGLKQGIYLLNCLAGNNKFTQKFIVK